MAVTQNPHIGRSKNAFATAVFTTWKGRNVMKGKPISVHNPDTPAQKKQRSAFGRRFNFGHVSSRGIRGASTPTYRK